MIQPGDNAPDFTLLTTADVGGEPNDFGMTEVNLASHKGSSNVVLLFFPAAYAPPCTDEMCSVSGSMDSYAALDAKVYAISPDNPFAQQAWSEAKGIKVPILSDYQRKTIEAYGMVLPDLIGLGPGTIRSAVVIDKQGVVRLVSDTETPLDMPDFDAVSDCLKSL
jgi:peroxiredoxin